MLIWDDMRLILPGARLCLVEHALIARSTQSREPTGPIRLDVRVHRVLDFLLKGILLGNADNETNVWDCRAHKQRRPEALCAASQTGRRKRHHCRRPGSLSKELHLHWPRL